MTVTLQVVVTCPSAGMYKETNATTFTAQLRGAVDPLSCITKIYEILKSYKFHKSQFTVLIKHMGVWV